MDDADHALDYQFRHNAAALAIRKAEAPPATGVCLNCEEPTAGRWCSVVCRDEWDHERRLR